jgi:hypothetical protein
MTNNHTPNINIPPPFDMDANPWQVGYYDGYTGTLDQRFWWHPEETMRADYRRGWSEGKHFLIFEGLIEDTKKDT